MVANINRVVESCCGKQKKYKKTVTDSEGSTLRSIKTRKNNSQTLNY